MRLIKVNVCEECPHERWESGGKKSCHEVYKVFPDNKGDETKIPDWCPLDKSPHLGEVILLAIIFGLITFLLGRVI